MTIPRVYRADLVELVQAVASNDARRLTSAVTIRGLIGSPIGDDATLNLLIDWASQAMADYCLLARPAGGERATFALETLRATWYETCAPRSPELLLPWRLPVTEIVSVVEDGTTLVAGTGFKMTGARPGVLLRLDGNSPTFWSSAKLVVEFKAGLTLPSVELEQPAIRQVTYAYKARRRDPSLRSREVPDVMSESYNVAGGDVMGDRLIPEVCAALSAWKDWI